MEKAEIKSIADYLKGLEEGLYEWDYNGIITPRPPDQTLPDYRTIDERYFQDKR